MSSKAVTDLDTEPQIVVPALDLMSPTGPMEGGTEGERECK